MPQITYVQPDGQRRSIPVAPGATVMLTAVANDIAGIVAECGGAAMCATCHVYVDEKFLHKIPEAEEAEKDMLDFVQDADKSSRLSCQIIISNEIDGIRVRMPKKQS